MEIIDNLEDEAAEVQKPEGMPPLRPDEPVPEEDFSMEDSVVILDEIYPPEMPAPPKSESARSGYWPPSPCSPLRRWRGSRSCAVPITRPRTTRKRWWCVGTTRK